MAVSGGTHVELDKSHQHISLIPSCETAFSDRFHPASIVSVTNSRSDAAEMTAETSRNSENHT